YQLAGSGGSYAILVDPLFFRIIQPTLTYTYAISGYREDIAGHLVSTLILDYAILTINGLLFIIIVYL
ncbi:hypothetical protein ACY0IW_14560, partial [Clostridium perfringens]